jgi:YrbI family 3-deoxy-D-manno-octulosonate 8-phosphate phosphatase
MKYPNEYSALHTLVVIPARGGSKGIPKKNIVPLCGKPLIAWTIEAANAAETVDRVVVSTDDPEIAKFSRLYGADVIDRPTELSVDTASSESALVHVLNELREAESYDPDLLVFLQCTAPLITADDIDGTVRTLLDEAADSALAAIPFHYFLWHRDKVEGSVGVNHDKTQRLMRQEREPEFLEAGSVYAMRVPGFLKAKHRFFGKTALHIVPASHWIEIDEPKDLDRAAALLQLRLDEDQSAGLPDCLRAVVCDFDGVLTNNKVLVSEEGYEAALCNRSDGLGIQQLRKHGIAVLVLSTETNPIVRERCKKLGVPCIFGLQDKLTALKTWLDQNQMALSDIVYVGNDLNDLSCMMEVGCAVAPADAFPEAKAAAKLVLSRSGGDGALRELAGLIINQQKGKTHGKAN